VPGGGSIAGGAGNGGYAHVIEDAKKFDHNIGKAVLARFAFSVPLRSHPTREPI
jgi:hypothetical protein